MENQEEIKQPPVTMKNNDNSLFTNIIFSCLQKSDDLYYECIKSLIDEDANVKKFIQAKVSVTILLSDEERSYLNFLIKYFEKLKKFPNDKDFNNQFSALFYNFENAIEIPQENFREHIYKFIEHRKYICIQNILTYMAKQPHDLTFANTLFKYLSIIEKLLDFSLTGSFDKNNIFIDGSQLYAEMKQRPKGMKTGIKAIDEKIGGMTAGTVTTLAGFTSHFKTTFALNIAYLNSYYSGYNVVYITLETPKQDMYWNLLSMHSYDTKFSKYNYIEHERIRRGLLTSEEETYLFDTIEKDLKNNGAGQIILLDETDFNTFSFSEIKRVLQSIDDTMPNGIHAIIVDYIQLCKFRDTNRQYDTNSQINYYVSFFRQLAQQFRTITDSSGSKTTKELVIILLAQLNREGWKKAKRNEGRYDITALADANELERGSFRVFTIYTDENMKARGSAQVQILKNRSGQTMYEPANISVIPEAYVVTDEEIGFDNYPYIDVQASMEAAFSNIDDANSLEVFGI